MYIHQITPYSVVNGPFERTVIHFQGCTLACPGCFNSATHPVSSGTPMSVEQILNMIPDGQAHITISGGEPFLQPKGLYSLVKSLNEKQYGIIVFSGFYLEEITKIKYGNEILSLIDGLIDGRYEENNLTKTGVKGSSNQTIHLFSDRYTQEQFEHRQVELLFKESGEIIITGFPEEIWKERLM